MATETAEVPETGSSLKVLLVADEQFRGPEFLDEIRNHIEGRSAQVEVFVITPALASSGLEHELASFDEPIKEAQGRLESIITELKDVGIDAVGQVGDGDPIVAIGDGLREFPADEIVVVGHDSGDRAYAEKDLWKRLHNEFHQPIVALMVGHVDGGGEAPAVERIERDPAHERTPEEIADEERNFPHLRPRDITGMLIGFFGTIALGLIAVAAGSSDDGKLSGAAAAILLLAIGAFLVNVAHVVGLLFFQSVRYEGIWEKFMARLSIIFTAVALVASLLLWASM